MFLCYTTKYIIISMYKKVNDPYHLQHKAITFDGPEKLRCLPLTAQSNKPSRIRKLPARPDLNSQNPRCWRPAGSMMGSFSHKEPPLKLLCLCFIIVIQKPGSSWSRAYHEITALWSRSLSPMPFKSSSCFHSLKTSYVERCVDNQRMVGAFRDFCSHKYKRNIIA